jgi:hypothetical protein
MFPSSSSNPVEPTEVMLWKQSGKQSVSESRMGWEEEEFYAQGAAGREGGGEYDAACEPAFSEKSSTKA